MPKVQLVLHNIRSAYNIGSIFRTADAVGVSKIYLTGFTPAPLDRFSRPRSDIAKAALGAEKAVLWECFSRIGPLLKKLKHEGVRIVAVEQDRRSVDYRRIRSAQNTAFIFGNEVTGLPKTVLTRADTIAEIPMRGSKESLNVSVAAGIVLFRMLGV